MRIAALGFGTVEQPTPVLAAGRYYAGQPHGVMPLRAWQTVAAVV